MKDEVRSADAQGYMPEPGHNSLGSSPLPLLKPASPGSLVVCLLHETKTTFISRSGRVVDGTSPENWRRATVRGFKSYLRRQRRQALSYCRVVTSNGLFRGGWATSHPPNAAIAGHKPGSETQSGHPFTTPYHHPGGKRRKKSSIFKGLRGVTLKENLCKNNVAKTH